MEIDALQTLRKGFLYLIIGTIVAVAGVLSTAGLVLMGLGAGVMPPLATLGSVAVGLAVLLVGLIIVLYAVFSKIRGGMRMLSDVDNSFRICYTGTTLMLIGLILELLGVVAALGVFASVHGVSKPIMPRPHGGVSAGLFGVMVFGVMVAALIGIALWIIGTILTFIVGAFKLHGRYNETLFMVAGILYIVDLVLTFIRLMGIFQFIGHILMYIALGDAIRAVSQRAQSGPSASL